ncbi:hypothetical protein P4O66_019673 [Electrophorus voltai]|uniref:Uncharacterized protein n=1 Tax=Electrophorus voltai TaxID=2609070 RepID=A0AAD9E520_9TELE|nr:hypothetical protein P4O66_019673 [Electrophorus voltai]
MRLVSASRLASLLQKHRLLRDAWDERGKKGRGKRDVNALPQPSQGSPPTAGESATGGVWRGGGPECGPGANSVESYGPTSGYRDWYNDVQYSKSDSIRSYYLQSSWPHSISPQQGRRPLDDFGGALSMVQGLSLRTPTDPSQTTRIDTWKWTPLGPTTPTWRQRGVQRCQSECPGPGPPPTPVLLMLARVGSLGSLALPFGVPHPVLYICSSLFH